MKLTLIGRNGMNNDAPSIAKKESTDITLSHQDRSAPELPEGEVEGSEEANVSAEPTGPVLAEAEDPAEDGGAGSPNDITEATAIDTVEDAEELTTALPEAEPEVTGSDQDVTTYSSLHDREDSATETPEMDGTTIEPGLIQEEAPAENPDGPEGESDPHTGDLDLSEQVNTPSPQEEGEGLSLADALDMSATNAETDLASVGEVSVRSAGAVAGPNAGEAEGSEETSLGSGTVVGVVAAIVIAIIGAVFSYITHQKKMLCFKVQGRNPDRAKEENGTQNEPQVLSSLLNSP
ncbi:uncharacterized protein LOC143512096 isoform X2 [Brachyhypopomus gauderio]|uniref:uncharacterized protein LOC143512096 isoform X2 n=1 Tax=Brachyhypopomus gauderio TaxID=698409 RepID=UPI004041F55A